MGCESEAPMVTLGIDDAYYTTRMTKLPLASALTGERYLWKANGDTVSTARDYVFIAREEGVYNMSFDIIDPLTPYHFEFTITVLHEEIEFSPFISRVYDYCPAPGQFVNEMPKYKEGDTCADMLQKAEESISGTNDIMISLGGFGGYVTFGFDHTVINEPGQYDFRIWGNSFYELTDPTRKGGSAEPGIVMVSRDANGNGLPDDEWFELAGSEYASKGTFRGFEVTYYRPEDNLTDIRWTSNDPAEPEGVIARSRFHDQSYWPGWYAGETITVRGTRLAPNAVAGGDDAASQWILKPYDWGYADNRPDVQDFKIDWAVDAEGNPATLAEIDFVKVYTGVLQNCGWLGETSTELCGGENLHALSALTAVTPDGAAAAVSYYNLQGHRVDNPSGGVFIRVEGSRTSKILLK